MLTDAVSCILRYLSIASPYVYRKPRNITRPGAASVGNPHPDATGLNKAEGVDVLLTLQYSRPGLSGPTYMVRFCEILFCIWCYVLQVYVC